MIKTNKSSNINITDSLEVNTVNPLRIKSEESNNYIPDTTVLGESTPFLDLEKIDKFINSNNLIVEDIEKNHMLSYLFNIENNKNNMLDLEIVNDIKDYKLKINTSICNQLDIFSEKVFENIESSKFFLQTVIDKYNNFSELKIKLEI